MTQERAGSGDGLAHRPEIVGEELVYDGWMRVRRLAVRMPDGGIVERHIEDHGLAVAVLLYDPVRRTALLVSQPRPPVIRAGEQPVLEAVAGSLEATGADHTARKEALEEAGVTIDTLAYLTTIWTMPSVSTERIALYMAAYDQAAITGSGGGADDENEGISVHEVPLAALATQVTSGLLPDAKTLILVQSLMLRRPELFD